MVSLAQHYHIFRLSIDNLTYSTNWLSYAILLNIHLKTFTNNYIPFPISLDASPYCSHC